VTEAADKHVNPELKAWFEAWETCTQTVLSQIFGHPVTFETPSEAPPAPTPICGIRWSRAERCAAR